MALIGRRTAFKAPIRRLPSVELDGDLALVAAVRAAEQLVFGEVSSGAEDDLKQATRLARHMVTHWGMSEKIGPVAFRRGEEHIFLGREMTQQRDFSENTAQIIDDEICSLLKGVEREVADLLQKNRDRLEALAQTLLQKETLEAGEIQSILNQHKE